MPSPPSRTLPPSASSPTPPHPRAHPALRARKAFPESMGSRAQPVLEQSARLQWVRLPPRDLPAQSASAAPQPPQRSTSTSQPAAVAAPASSGPLRSRLPPIEDRITSIPSPVPSASYPHLRSSYPNSHSPPWHVPPPASRSMRPKLVFHSLRAK